MSKSQQPKCSARCFTALPLAQYRLALPPRARLRSTCARCCPCAPLLPYAPRTASFPRCSPFGLAFSVRTRSCLPDERPPLRVSHLLYRGALLRCPVGVPVAVRYGAPSVTPTRYDGGVRGCSSPLPGTRCARSVQRDPAPSGRSDASPGPRGRYGVGVDRVSEVVRLPLPRVPVRRRVCKYTGRSRRAAPPGHAPVTGMTLAFASSPSLDRLVSGDAVMGVPHRRAAVAVTPR